MGRAGALAYLGKHDKAVAEALLVSAEKSLTGINLYNLACTFAVASAAARRDEKLSVSERNQRGDQYAVQAVSVLDRARAAGFFNVRAPVEWMKKDKDLDALRERADYKKLLTDVEAQTKSDNAGKSDRS